MCFETRLASRILVTSIQRVYRITDKHYLFANKVNRGSIHVEAIRVIRCSRIVLFRVLENPVRQTNQSQFINGSKHNRMCTRCGIVFTPKCL